MHVFLGPKLEIAKRRVLVIAVMRLKESHL